MFDCEPLRWEQSPYYCINCGVIVLALPLLRHTYHQRMSDDEDCPSLLTNGEIADYALTTKEKYSYSKLVNNEIASDESTT